MVSLIGSIGCAQDRERVAAAMDHIELPPPPPPPAPVVQKPVAKPAMPEAKCAEAQKVLVFENGRNTASLCPGEALERGLTVLDLSDEWVPSIFREDRALGAAGVQPYLERYRALAARKLGKGERWEQARQDEFFELYGIPPTFSLLRARLGEGARHACHAKVDNSGLAAMTTTIRQEPLKKSGERIKQARWKRAYINKRLAKLKLTSVDELAKVNPWYKREVARLQRLESAVAGIKAVQAHLVCEGAKIPRRFFGYYSHKTSAAVERFQRKNMLISDGDLGPHTREGFLVDSREHDYRAFLRVLRARVVSVTGLIEDGSANESWGKVMGRYIDAPAFRVPTGHKVPEHAAGDLISKATEAAAVALGWEGPRQVGSFFDMFADGKKTLRVAVKLPPPPDYHSKHMELFAEIDRGEVWYDYPGAYWGGCAQRQGTLKPQLTLYARHGDKKIALVRWHTTIGGWNKEKMKSGWIGLRYKNSDVGRRLWRDLIVSPAWRPLPSTPDEELVQRTRRGWALKYHSFGPSYRSAYGLVMLIHHIPTKHRGKPAVWDNGIRTHGSASIASIIKGCSHGCHRLFNHQSVRLASFLLAHRHTVRRGPIKESYRRKVAHKGRSWKLHLKSRGYKYELTPPIEVNVLKGKIRGKRQKPFKGVRALNYAWNKKKTD